MPCKLRSCRRKLKVANFPDLFNASGRVLDANLIAGTVNHGFEAAHLQFILGAFAQGCHLELVHHH